MALCRFCLFLFKRVRLEHLNATRMSVAAVSSTEAYIYLYLSSQMQTSLATWTKNPEYESIRDFYFFLAY